MFEIAILTTLLGAGLLIGILRSKRSTKNSAMLSPFDATRDHKEK
jgi:hypothetical protein